MLAQNVKGKECKKRNGGWVQNVKGALAWTSVRRVSKISSSRQEWDDLRASVRNFAVETRERQRASHQALVGVQQQRRRSGGVFCRFQHAAASNRRGSRFTRWKCGTRGKTEYEYGTLQRQLCGWPSVLGWFIRNCAHRTPDAEHIRRILIISSQSHHEYIICGNEKKRKSFILRPNSWWKIRHRPSYAGAAQESTHILPLRLRLSQHTSKPNV